jgi:hyperosmotically inducible periplasmic protein
MNTAILKRVLLTAALVAGAAAASTRNQVPANDVELGKQVVHEIRMYDRYTIWDNVSVQVRDGNVELTGQVSQPYKRDDLGRIVQHIPGVAGVTNQLEVLPLSPFDDRLRLQIARAVYGHTALNRYAYQALPPIHIIVDNGKVRLEGVVNNEMEKQIAGMQAQSAGLSFGPVVNNLRVENPKPKKG